MQLLHNEPISFLTKPRLIQAEENAVQIITEKYVKLEIPKILNLHSLSMTFHILE